MYEQSPEGEWERPNIHTCLSRVLKTSGNEQVELNQQINKHIYMYIYPCVEMHVSICLFASHLVGMVG